MDKLFIKERYSNIRMAKNISARKLSLDLGQSTEYINQIENGRSIPSLEGLSNFCDYFNITLKEFFDDGQTYPIQYKELLHELNLLTPAELDLIIKLIKTISENKK